MNAFIDAWARFVIAQRSAIIGFAVLLIGLTLVTGGVIPFDNSTERYFIPGDPALLDYESLYDNFGDNEYLIVGLEAAEGTDDVFMPDTLSALSSLSDFLDFHPYVTQLRSLSNYQYIHADGDDLRTDYLIDDIDALASDADEIARIKSILEEEELAVGTLITEDFRHTRIAARLEYNGDTSEIKVAVTQDLYQFIEEENLQSSEYNLRLSGYPLINERFETVSAEDTAVLIPIMIVVMITILTISFRSLFATMFPWLVIAGGLLLLLELQYYIGIPHTTVDSAAIPSTMIIIGIGISIHVMLEFFYACQKGEAGKEAAASTIRGIWLPAFFTAITTSAGFLALSVTRLLPLREFALLGSIGPILLFLFALTVLPAMLSFIKSLPSSTDKVLQEGYLTKITGKLPELTKRFRFPILIAGVLTVLFSIWSLPQVQIDTNYVTLFRPDNPVRQDILYFDDYYKGTVTLDIVLDSGEVDGVKDPAFLRDAEEIQEWLDERGTLGPVNSLVDYLKEINKALNGDEDAYYRLPETRQLAAQLLLLYDSAGPNEDLSDIIDFENQLTRLVIPVVNMPASELQQELADIESYMEENYSHLGFTITGTMVLLTEQQIYTAEGMLLSFLVAMAVITFFFIVLFRSFKYGILSIIPSVVPIVLAAGIASTMGILLDQSAVVVFAMTMGLAVDDAIHVMSRYLTSKQSGLSTDESIRCAMNESGRAVLFTSMVLIFGFGVLIFGSFTTVINVGLFGSIIMSLALIGDLIFLPAILYCVDSDADSTNIENASLSGGAN